jgi:hypothetical protein
MRTHELAVLFFRDLEDLSSLLVVVQQHAAAAARLGLTKAGEGGLLVGRRAIDAAAAIALSLSLADCSTGLTE